MEVTEIAQLAITTLVGLSSLVVQFVLKGFKSSLDKLDGSVNQNAVNTAIVTERLHSMDRRLTVTEDRVTNIEKH